MRKRADCLLTERGLCESRAQAQRLILAGRVRSSADAVVRKPGQLLSVDTALQVTEAFPYVGRGALKLLAALGEFTPDLTGAVAMDVGASTGGFTDVLLRHGAKRVYAVDTGYGQLHSRLRADPRVINIEKTNARYLTSETIPEPIDVLCADVSFISLRKVLPACAPLLRPTAWICVLIKPQFEAGQVEVGRGGVVRDPVVRERCVQEICRFAETELHWRRLGVIPSPIQGPAGNVEFLAAFSAAGAPAGEHCKSPSSD